MRGESTANPEGEIKISFGYQCNGHKGSSCEASNGCEILSGSDLPRTSSFSCLSGAALSANATLANTNICNGVIGAEILPSWDSPNSFRRIPSSPTLSRLDMLSSSLQSSMSNLSCSPSSPPDAPEYDYLLKSMSAPSGSEGFLSAMEVQVAGGAAGEDRVQAVCSEENGWLFCGIYDGFNGRDAADFLAGTLYETIMFYFNLLNLEIKQEAIRTYEDFDMDRSIHYIAEANNSRSIQSIQYIGGNKELEVNNFTKNNPRPGVEFSSDSFRHGVLDGLQRALSQAENDFLYMVEQEMEDRPDLVSVGSCVLVVFLVGKDLYTLNLGDSRAVLATYGGDNEMNCSGMLKTVQLTDNHSVENEVERRSLLRDHPDDPMPIIAGKVKGKLKVTRALGVGYLKKGKKKLRHLGNNGLMTW